MAPFLSVMVQSCETLTSAQGWSEWKEEQVENAGVLIKPTTERHHGTDKIKGRENNRAKDKKIPPVPHASLSVLIVLSMSYIRHVFSP